MPIINIPKPIEPKIPYRALSENISGYFLTAAYGKPTIKIINNPKHMNLVRFSPFSGLRSIRLVFNAKKVTKMITGINKSQTLGSTTNKACMSSNESVPEKGFS